MPERKLMVWKKVCEAVLKSGDRRLAQRIGEAHALEGVPLERIAERESSGRWRPDCSSASAIAAPRIRLADCPVAGLVVLGRVEVLLGVEDLEAHVERAVADIGLGEAEQ